VVSIAESLNYRIFERKWRTGEALNGLPRACRILSVEQKPNPTEESWFVGDALHLVFYGDRVVTPKTTSSKRRFMGNSFSCAKFGSSESFLEQQTYLNNTLVLTKISFVTDLSAAGSPAELKHITQRRKRKQP
jgi:hypothetical protein